MVRAEMCLLSKQGLKDMHIDYLCVCDLSLNTHWKKAEIF